MKFKYEEQAFRNEPIPMDATAKETIQYMFLRNLYWSMNKGIISKEQAQAQKNKVMQDIESKWKAAEFEQRCWENSARRTKSACHAMMMYRDNRTLENADYLVKMLEWLDDECAVAVKQENGQAVCPICKQAIIGANSKPNFCGHCGCMLGWEEQHED